MNKLRWRMQFVLWTQNTVSSSLERPYKSTFHSPIILCIDNSSLHELWALFHFLYPDVFTAQTSDAFKEAFNLTKGTYNTKFIESASTLLGKMMLRRMKVDMAEIKVPPKEELLVYVPLTPLQRYVPPLSLLGQRDRLWLVGFGISGWLPGWILRR